MTATWAMASSARVERAQPARRQQEGIAAGDDHLPDLRPGADVVERRLELGRRQAVAAGPDLLAAEAEAAIDRAGMARLQQHAIGIAVDDALDRRKPPVADGIRALLRRRVQLGRIGHELAGDGIGGIARLDQRRHVRRDRDGEALGHRRELGLARLRHQPARAARARPAGAACGWPIALCATAACPAQISA